MPRLVLLAPCENVIVSNENKISLISLLENLTFTFPANSPVPPNATAPMRWFALTVWEKEASDAGKEFESYVQIGPLRSATAKFKFKAPLHRVIAQIVGFPVVFGELRLTAFLKEVGVGDFAKVGDYPLTVQNVPPGPVN